MLLRPTLLDTRPNTPVGNRSRACARRGASLAGGCGARRTAALLAIALDLKSMKVVDFFFLLFQAQHSRGSLFVLVRVPQGFLFVISWTVGACRPAWCGVECPGQGWSGNGFLMSSDKDSR